MLQNALPAVGLLLLMVLVAWALQRWRKHLPGQGRQSGPALKVLGTIALGPQQRVVTLQVGQGADAQCLVLGVTAASVNTLHSLPLPAEAAPGGAEPPTGFAARLARLTVGQADALQTPQ